ncbi:recombinase RecA [Halorussus salilacus]|uniref:RAD55 family ATPase n=1 Tax=Halorussus salilacus TaxID=2953750 RepID=UPI00209FCEA4|nr:ATPase domain-containing protein [Halorussus salilacus]USZ66767.1 recombinase RecA [Halorussus salilacus]
MNGTDGSDAPHPDDPGSDDSEAVESPPSDSGASESPAGDSDAKTRDSTDSDASDSDATDPGLCDFCRLPLSKGRETLDHGDRTYEFCSGACRDAMAENDRVFTEYHGFRRIRTGVSGLDRFLPQGFPRNSFVLVSNDEGARDDALLTELVWRTLERGEPAVVITFTQPPISVVEGFLSLDWNVLPYLESGQLHVLDCFTYRVSDRDRMFERMNEWNRHIHRITRGVTETVRDPGDVSELQNKLDSCLEALGMSDRGFVAVDSLTEFGSLVQPIRAYDCVKDVRADVCKGRFVPVFAGATLAHEDQTFPHDLGYAVDGIVDMQMNGGIVDDTLIKRLRIRKMNGVLSIPEWVAYEFTAGKGLVTFDPIQEMRDTYEGGGRERPRGQSHERPRDRPGPNGGDGDTGPDSGPPRQQAETRPDEG